MKRTALVLILVLTVAGCAPLSLDYRQGVRAEMSRNYDEAVQQYQKAALEHPNEPAYRMALVRARALASLHYLHEARLLVSQNKKTEAEAAYRKVLVFDPQNHMAAAELKALTAPPEKPKPGQRIEGGPVRLKGSGEPIDLSFRNEVSVRSIFQTLGRVAGVNFLYDDTFRDTNIAIDLTGKDLEQAISFLCVATKNFPRVIDEKTVIIVPDNPSKRMQYELNAIKTFYLSNIDASETMGRLMQMVRGPLRGPTLQVDKTLNSVTIRDTPQSVALAEKLIRSWDKPKAEVLIEIEIMEVSRLKEKNLGIDFSSGNLELAFVPPDISDKGFFPVQGVNFGDLANYQMTVPTAMAQILSADSDTKIIAQPKIRGMAGEKIKYVVGQKVPIVNSQFAAVAAGGLNTQPIVNYNLQDIGITIEMTPKVHLEGEVSLEMDLTVSSIAGTGTADIPIIANREVKNVVRLKDGETNLLAGLLRDEERKSVGGITGLKDIPLLGNLFSATQRVIDQSDVVMTITPHIIRALDITEEDTKPLWVNPENLAGMAAAGAGAGASRGAGQPPVPTEEEPAANEEPGANGVYLSPSSFETARDREFRINVELSTTQEIGNASFAITFDPRVLRLKNILEGGGLQALGDKVPFLQNISGGTATIGFSAPPSGPGFKNRGTIAVLVFQAVAPVQSASIGFTSATAGTPMGQAVVLETGEATVSIR